RPRGSLGGGPAAYPPSAARERRRSPDLWPGDSDAHRSGSGGVLPALAASGASGPDDVAPVRVRSHPAMSATVIVSLALIGEATREPSPLASIKGTGWMGIAASERDFGTRPSNRLAKHSPRLHFVVTLLR